MKHLYESIVDGLLKENEGDYYLYHERINQAPLYLKGSELVDDISEATKYPTEAEAEEAKKDFEEETGKKLVLTQFKK